MDVTPLIKANQNIIQSYADGAFKVSGQRFEHAVIVTPTEVLQWDAMFETLDGGAFDALDAAEIDVVLLGCGKSIRFLTPDLKKAYKKQGFSVDVMDTGAACRTYNVLMAEGRRVAAALFPFSG